MIRAQHNRLAQFVFHHYLQYLFHKHFTAFYLLEDLPKINSDLPLLLIPNHSTWWDGFFVHHLNRHFYQRKLYLMMLDRQIRKYSFFKRVGAYGIDQDNPSAIKQSLKYSVQILNEQNSGQNMLCIFPQGELLPWHSRPIVFKRGIDLIIRQLKKPVIILPLVMRVELLDEQRPDVFFLLGQPYIAEINTYPGADFFRDQMTDLLQFSEELISTGKLGKPFFKGKTSIHHRFDGTDNHGK